MATKKEVWGIVIDSINTLPEPAKTIATMRVLNAKTFEEIAVAVGKPVDTVKTIYYRNMDNVRKKMMDSLNL